MAIAFVLGGLWFLARRRAVGGGLMVILAVGAFIWWNASTSVPGQLVGTVPYLTTLVVLSVASQRLRPPAADGRPYRKGQGS